MKTENLLITISLGLLIFTNSLSEVVSLSTITGNLLNLAATTLAIISLSIQLKKRFSHKCAVLNK